MPASNARLAGRAPVRRVALAFGIVSTSILGSSCGSSSTAPQPINGTPLAISFSPIQVAQGQTDTFTITWTGSPPPPLNGQPTNDTLLLVLTGIATGEASVIVPPNVYGVSGTLAIPAASFDGTIQFHAYIRSLGDSGVGSLTVLDNIPPVVGSNNGNAWVIPTSPLPSLPVMSGAQGGGLGSLPGITFIGGITDSAWIGVSDNHGLAWAGWDLGAPANLRDSVPVNGLSATLTIPMATPSALGGTVDSVAFFSRDLDNNLREYRSAQHRLLYTRTIR